MKKTIVIGIIITCIIVIGVVILFMYNYTVHPASIGVFDINVSENKIAFKGVFSGSAIWYKGYKVEYHDESLYFKIKGSNIKSLNSSGDIDISIPNTYGKINAVYLQDDLPSGNVLIWSKK